MLAERIKAGRALRKLSRADLASKSGVGFATIQRIEQGRGGDVRQSTLERIADTLVVSVDWLLGRAPLESTGSTRTLRTSAPDQPKRKAA